MRDLINQVRAALSYKLYYPALFVTLALPDICAVLQGDTRDVGERYVAWYKKNGGKFLTGEECYKFRCSLLHQGSTIPDKKHQTTYSRIILMEPSYITTKACNIQNLKIFNVEDFCENILHSVENWLVINEGSVEYKRNYNRFIRRYPNGFPPYIPGVPLIT